MTAGALLRPHAEETMGRRRHLHCRSRHLQPARRQFLLALLAAAATALLVGACPASDPGKDAKATGERADGFVCKQPPTIGECDAPPNGFSKDKIYCWGCNCAGPNAVAACSVGGDCRLFANGCIPKSYSLCDQNASDFILGLCGYCFFREAGGVPKDCNKILFEAGTGPRG